MEIVWLIIAVTIAPMLWVGASRMAARSGGPLLAGLALLLIAAGLCWLIGDSKSGGFLAGIVGLALALLLSIAAGGLLAGAALRWLYERLRPVSPQCPPLRPAWDIWGIAGFSLLAVVLSAME